MMLVFLASLTLIPTRAQDSSQQSSAFFGKRDKDALDARTRHSPHISRIPYCSFSPSPVNTSFLLGDLLPRLQHNELNGETFGRTKSVKWRFSSHPGSLEAEMGDMAAVWARPLVDAWQRNLHEQLGSFGGKQAQLNGGGGADLFVLNGLSVPCGTEVSAHYDDTVVSDNTPLRVSVLYLSLPTTRGGIDDSGGDINGANSSSSSSSSSSDVSNGYKGGQLHAFSGRGAALRGDAPICLVQPTVGTAVHFRGDLFHGITTLDCRGHCEASFTRSSRESAENNIDFSCERVSVVLEQYDLTERPLVLSIDIDGRPEELKFTDIDGDNSSLDVGDETVNGKENDNRLLRLRKVAEAFAAQHGLTGGSGCSSSTSSSSSSSNANKASSVDANRGEDASTTGGGACIVNLILDRMLKLVGARDEARLSPKLVSNRSSPSAAVAAGSQESSGAAPPLAKPENDTIPKATKCSNCSMGCDASSDLASIEMKVSRLKGVGFGVFARRALPRGTIVCEMRGHYVLQPRPPFSVSVPLPNGLAHEKGDGGSRARTQNYEQSIDRSDNQDKTTGAEDGVNKERGGSHDKMLKEAWDRTVVTPHGILLEQGICSLINDCRRVESAATRVFRGAGRRDTSGVISGNPQALRGCWEGYDRNTKLIVEEKSRKPFVVATRDIAEGEELFYDYGDGYWEHWNWRQNSELEADREVNLMGNRYVRGRDGGVSADSCCSHGLGRVDDFGLGCDSASDTADLKVLELESGLITQRAVGDGTMMCEMRGRFITTATTRNEKNDDGEALGREDIFNGHALPALSLQPPVKYIETVFGTLTINKLGACSMIKTACHLKEQERPSLIPAEVDNNEPASQSQKTKAAACHANFPANVVLFRDERSHKVFVVSSRHLNQSEELILPPGSYKGS